MLKLRKNPLSNSEIELTFVENEKVSELVSRTVKEHFGELPEESHRHFHVIVDGLELPQDLWGYTNVEKNKTYLVAPKLRRGEGAQLFKQIAIIAVAVVASAFVSPAVGTGLYGALAAAGITIAGTIALNALIPNPPLEGLGGLGGSNSFEASQMYTIANQQNVAKKFGKVPRVYGQHRIFPNVVANPYTEIEAEPGSGKLVQTFYCIYDFGFGPVEVGDIYIGDTLLKDFSDAEYRLVDLHKPVVSEGTWDDATFPSFALYKGDVEKELLGIALDKNQEQNGPLDEYQVVRNASDLVGSSNQEITLDFQCPNGLIGYGTDGKTSQREITLLVEFSKVGENIWRRYNDPTYVFDSSGAGGVATTSYKSFVILKPLVNLANWETIGGPREIQVPHRSLSGGFFSSDTIPAHVATRQDYGIRKGATYIVASNNDANVGDTIVRNGVTLGRVVSITPDTNPSYSRYNFATPTQVDVVVFSWETYSIVDDNLFPGIVRSFGQSQEDAESPSNKIERKIGSFGAVTIKAQTTQPYFASVKFKPREVAQYKVRVTRVSTYSSKTFQVQDKLTLLSVQTRFDRDPILTDKRHLFLEVKIRATNQLNGAVQNLSAIASSVLDVYDSDTQTWNKQITNNPAWVFCDLMTGQVNKRAIDKSRLHMPSILEWAELCEEVPTPPPDADFVAPRFQCNFVLDFDTTLQSLVNTVTNAYQASLNIIDGKYGVLVDKLKTVPVQVFTPRNSWEFQSTRSYTDVPHAFKVQYIDPLRSWQTNEAIVYDDGFDEDTAENIEDLSAFGCTNFEQAWRYGRYVLAQARLRQERITISVDFEHLVCTRGDLVYLTQDVMKSGGTAARVKTVAGDVITIDNDIETSGLLSYGYVASKVNEIVTSTLTVINSNTFQLAGTMPNVGDIIVIGEVGNIIIECLVKSITPNNDLSATLELVENVPAIYEAESTNTIPIYDPQLNTNVDQDSFAPGVVENLAVIANTYRVLGSDYEYYITLDWDAPTGAAYENFEIYVNSGGGYELVDFSTASEFEYVVEEQNLGVLHSFKVLAVSANGKKIPLIEAPFVTATPESKTAPPSSVEALYIDITNQVISLSWPPISDPDLKEYFIRYSANTTSATWEASIPLLRVSRDTTLVSTQGRTGTYFIKAVDFNGNESALAAQARTSIPNLFDLNVIDETTDFPTLPGELVSTETDGVGLVLKKKGGVGPDANEYFSEGFYYYENFLDVGEIYTVRLQSLVEAEGFTLADLMSNWVTLSDVLALSNAGTAAWDVETYYRGTAQFNVMSEWANLSSIDPISEGSQDIWTPWTKFTIGDFTARIFQFRLKLISNVPAVTPRVFSGVIRSDMPDRVERFDNLTAPDTGLTITYSPAFKGPGTTPNIQITQDNASQGDYYVITGKTLEGFTITFYDATNTPVARQFDALVVGYGRKALAVI